MTTDVPSAFELIISIAEGSPLPELTAAECSELFLSEYDPDGTETLGPVPHKLQVLMAHAAHYMTQHNDTIPRLLSAEDPTNRAAARAEHDQLCRLLHTVGPIIGDALAIEVEAYGDYQLVGVTPDWQLIGKEPCQPDVSAELGALLAGIMRESSPGMEAATFRDEDGALVVMTFMGGPTDSNKQRH